MREIAQKSFFSFVKFLLATGVSKSAEHPLFDTQSDREFTLGMRFFWTFARLSRDSVKCGCGRRMRTADGQKKKKKLKKNYMKNNKLIIKIVGLYYFSLTKMKIKASREIYSLKP